MNCKKCGKEMRIGSEQVGIDERQLPVIHRFAYCDNCMEKTDLDVSQQPNNQQLKPLKKKDGILSILAAVFGFITCTFWLGFIFAIIDLCTDKNKERKHLGSWFAIVMSLLWIGVSFLGNDEKQTETTQTTEVATTEITTEEATTQAPKITVEEIKEQAIEVTYEDIYRNPETYTDKPVKITLYINEYDTAYLGIIDVYYCTADGKDVYVTDYREIQEPTIASGDTVILYGLGSGLATLTESQKNMIGFTTDSEKSQIPSIDMYYVELQ